jgi:hypothetical protein
MLLNLSEVAEGILKELVVCLPPVEERGMRTPNREGKMQEREEGRKEGATDLKTPFGAPGPVKTIDQLHFCPMSCAKEPPFFLQLV